MTTTEPDQHNEDEDEDEDEDAEFILSMDFEEAAAACKDNGLPASSDLQTMQQALLVHFTWNEPEPEGEIHRVVPKFAN